MGTNPSFGFLSASDAARLDEDLFSEYKFSLQQLMELAGLGVASAVAEVYDSEKEKPVVIVCGPGNNGGDGLVASRHLRLFGFSDVSILLGKQPSKPFFLDLIEQAKGYDVKVSYNLQDFSDFSGLVIDALFGFSFKPPVRPDYEPMLSFLKNCQRKNCTIASVDCPSGWDVEKGPLEEASDFMPTLLVSLSAPKKCSQFFTGLHFLAGRFIPADLAQKYNLKLPAYEGTKQIIRLN